MNSNFESVPCDFCQSVDTKTCITQTDVLHGTTSKDFSIQICNQCQLSFTNPRPTEKEIANFYGPNYAFHHKKNMVKEIIIRFLKFAVNNPIIQKILLPFSLFMPDKMILYISPKIKNPMDQFLNKKNIKFLDIGMGAGSHAHFWGEKSSLQYYAKIFQVFGVEPGENAREVLKNKGFNNIYKTIDDIPKEFKFDVIRMNWSLEHVHSPGKYFLFFKQQLAKNGKVILCLPNYNGIIYKTFPRCVELPIHLYHFKKNDIENYCTKFDLCVESFKTFSYPGMFYFSAIYFKEMMPFKKMTFAQAIYFQKTLNLFDLNEMGNDFIATLSKKE